MKYKHWFTLLVFLTCSTVVHANSTSSIISHKLDNLTQEDGLTALKIGDTLGFEIISRAELEEVRGEAISPWVISKVVPIVAKFFGNKTASKFENFLQNAETPSFADYKEVFGSKTAAILSVIPWYLKPAIVQ